MAATWYAIFCPPELLRVYDTVGMFGLFILVFWGGGLSEQADLSRLRIF